MKHGIKLAAFFLLYYSGIEWLLSRLLRLPYVAILMYHGVCDDAPMPAHINFHVARDVFERQMHALKRRYRILPLSQLVGALQRGEPLPTGVVLTFDDGYQNNLKSAAPVLKQLGLPYTIFVATAYVENGRWIPLNEVYWRWSEGKLSWDELNELRRQIRQHPSSETPRLIARGGDRPASVAAVAEEAFAMLRWEEIRELAQAGAEFGSHTHSHCNMTVESDAQQRTELALSKELLERHVQQPVRLFAYPYGYHSEASRRNVLQAGFECAIATEYAVVTRHSDPYRLPRLGIQEPSLWFFTGEILYQMLKQAFKDTWGGLLGKAIVNDQVAKHAKEPQA